MMASIFNSLSKVAAGSVANYLVRILGFLVLSRLLDPRDFGIYATAIAILGFFELFVALGVGQAMVQLERLDDRDINFAFIFAASIGLICFFLLRILTEDLSALFSSAELGEVIEVLSPLVFLKAITVFANGILVRDLRFGRIIVVESCGLFAGSFLLPVFLAWNGYGYWSLVFGHFFNVALVAIAMVLMAPQRLGLSFPDWGRIKSLTLLSSGFTCGRIFNYIAQKSDYLIVSALLGPISLGLYSRAYGLMQMAINGVINVADKVMFPYLARCNDDLERQQSFLRISWQLIFCLYIPLSTYFFVAAGDLIRLVLGERWEGATDAFRILVVFMVFRAGYKAAGSVIRARGKVWGLTLIQIVYSLLVVLGATIGSNWGIEGVGLGVGIALLCNFMLMNMFASQILEIESYRVLVALIRPLSLFVLIVLSLFIADFALIALFGERSFHSFLCCLISVIIVAPLALVFRRQFIADELRLAICTSAWRLIWRP